MAFRQHNLPKKEKKHGSCRHGFLPATVKDVGKGLFAMAILNRDVV